MYILHYLLLRGWKEILPRLGFRTLIFDEVQELRHSGTEKYSAASLAAEKCEHVIGLSGTPIYNRGGEIWNVVNILDYHFLGDWESFSREWCWGYGNAIVAKPELLGAYLRREGLMLRRVKQDVLSELPPKRRLVQELDWNDRVYARLMEPVLPQLLRWSKGRASRRPSEPFWRQHLPSRPAGPREWPRRPMCASLCARCWKTGKRCCFLPITMM